MDTCPATFCVQKAEGPASDEGSISICDWKCCKQTQEPYLKGCHRVGLTTTPLFKHSCNKWSTILGACSEPGSVVDLST